MSTSTQSTPAPSASRRAISFAVRFILPLALTVALVWYMFKKVNFSDMMHIIRQGVDYWWILLAMGISVLSHIARAARWRIQLRALDIRPPFMALCCSIFGTYALNLVFPRLGEVWRCTYIARRQKAPFSTVLGSMVADRLSDTLVVFLLFLLTFVVATPAINAFLAKYPVGQDVLRLVEQWWFWVAVVLGVVACWALFRFGGQIPVVAKVRDMVAKVWKGFAVVASMPGRGRFIALTLAIWTCYFMQLYVAFYAFSFTKALCFEPGMAAGFEPCLVAFVLSSIGMAIPSNGGLGPWNIAVIFGLAIFGIGDAQGTAFAMLVWSAQTVMLIILGIYTMIYIAVSKKETTAVGVVASEMNADKSNLSE